MIPELHYLTTTQFAAKRGVSPSRIQQLIKRGRIPGAELYGATGTGGRWLIPSDAEITPAKHGEPFRHNRSAK